MKRILLTLLAGLVLGLGSPALAQEGSDSTSTAPEYDWVLHYYMAYDNNLARCGPPIIKMLAKGITSEKVAVVVSADYPDSDGMQRYVLRMGQAPEMTQLSEEGSAEEEVLASELSWIRQNFRAKKYGVVFLNHGGGLGQMSVDDKPREGGQRWLYPPKVAKVITDWRAQVKAAAGEVELVFYQQCGKGSLENYHCMAPAGKFVMGSQTVVGAPNYYYTKALNHLCQNLSIDGEALAKQITKDETPNMFTTYTTMSSAELANLPKEINAVVEPLLAVESLKLPALGRSLKPCFDFSKREIFFDGLALFEQLYDANGLDKAPIKALESYHAKLITSHRVSPSQNKGAETWCGYSIFFPVSPRQLVRYKDYPIYAETKLDELFKHVFKSVAERRAAMRAAAKKKAEQEQQGGE